MGCGTSSDNVRWRHPEKEHDKEGDMDPNNILSTSLASGQLKISMNFEVGGKIREGSLGDVYELMVKCDRLAVKVMDTRSPPLWRKDGIYDNKLTDSSALPGLQAAQHEMEVWRRVSGHPNVVMLFDAFLSEERYIFVMEMCPISLYDRLCGKLDSREVKVDHVFRGMLRGVERLHIMGIVHRDIHLRNFLLGGQDGWTLKICDFGLSAQLPSKDCKLDLCCGTPRFNSPEMLGGEGYGCATDVWSLGVAIYWMLYGDFPYGIHCEDSSDVLQRSILKGKPEPSFLYAFDISREVNLQQPLELRDGHTERASRETCTAAQSHLPIREFVFDQTMGSLGLKFVGVPPEEIRVKEVTPNSWAVEQGIEPMDVLHVVNHLNVQRLRPEQWPHLMKKRPLRMRFSRGAVDRRMEGRLEQVMGGILPDGAVEGFARALLDRSPSTRCTATSALRSPCLQSSTMSLAPVFDKMEHSAESINKLCLAKGEFFEEDKLRSIAGSDFVLHTTSQGNAVNGRNMRLTGPSGPRAAVPIPITFDERHEAECQTDASMLFQGIKISV